MCASLLETHFLFGLIQWRSVCFWHPGQEVKLVPHFLTFFRKISKNGRPKTNFDHFKNWKIHELIELLSDQNVYQIVGLLSFISGLFQRPPLKWRQGHVPPLSPSPSYNTGLISSNLLSIVKLQHFHHLNTIFMSFYGSKVILLLNTSWCTFFRVHVWFCN